MLTSAARAAAVPCLTCHASRLARCQEGRASGGGGPAVDRSISSMESAAAAEALAAADEGELPTTLSSDDEGALGQGGGLLRSLLGAGCLGLLVLLWCVAPAALGCACLEC